MAQRSLPLVQLRHKPPGGGEEVEIGGCADDGLTTVVVCDLPKLFAQKESRADDFLCSRRVAATRERTESDTSRCVRYSIFSSAGFFDRDSRFLSLVFRLFVFVLLHRAIFSRNTLSLSLSGSCRLLDFHSFWHSVWCWQNFFFLSHRFHSILLVVACCLLVSFSF